MTVHGLFLRIVIVGVLLGLAPAAALADSSKISTVLTITGIDDDASGKATLKLKDNKSRLDIKLKALDDFLRLEVILFRLAGETDDDIRRNCDPGTSRLHFFADFDEFFGFVWAMHPLQDPIRTTLQTDVQMWTDLVAEFRHDCDQFASHLGGFDARESHAKVAVNLYDLT